jgi:hypothetical protein
MSASLCGAGSELEIAAVTETGHQNRRLVKSLIQKYGVIRLLWVNPEV